MTIGYLRKATTDRGLLMQWKMNGAEFPTIGTLPGGIIDCLIKVEKERVLEILGFEPREDEWINLEADDA
jgi:hypothetical protein